MSGRFLTTKKDYRIENIVAYKLGYGHYNDRFDAYTYKVGRKSVVEVRLFHKDHDVERVFDAIKNETSKGIIVTNYENGDRIGRARYGEFTPKHNKDEVASIAI